MPIPDETLLVLSGYLISKGELSPWLTPLMVLGGSITGITLSYALGIFGGRPLMLKYGKWIKVTPERLDSACRWFDKIGKWLLIIGYYLPGVRHLAGFTVGTVKVRYSEFALFAYTGACLWSTTFLLIGYFGAKL
ncbi:MAG: DedA family protein [Gammaproteobacteria bacterium]